MKSDALFYELFKIDPKSLFELVGLKAEGDYAFESITAKTTEKRFDGFFRRRDAPGPNVFLEVQGWQDPKIYWRTFREICTWYEQSDSTEAFTAVVLFTDRKYDPGNPSLSCVRPNRMIRAYLGECLKKTGGRPGALTVLRPFALSDKKELQGAVRKWKADIFSLNLPEYQMKNLAELLVYAVLQRFPELTRKEIEAMLELTPLDKTVAGQELIQIGMRQGIEQGIQQGIKQGIKQGIEQGIEQGMDKGELIGEIRMAQRILKRTVSSRQELAEKPAEELREIFRQLESEWDELS